MKIMMLNQAPRDPTNDEYDERVRPMIQSYASPGTEVVLDYPDDHPGAAVGEAMNHQGVRSELNYAVSSAALVRKAVWAEQNGFDAVIQSNNFEPGVEVPRLAVKIPVLGLCRTTIHAAANLADRIGVTVPFDGYAILTRKLLRSYGLEHYITDVRSMTLPGVPRGEQVAIQRPIIFERAVEEMRKLVRETGAQCIVPLGGAVIPYIVDPVELQREVGVPVLNPKAVGIHYAEMCVRLGMSHSPLSYPRAELSLEDFTAYAFSPVAG
jgi:Asp/Glu/hydantoin racemase